MEVIRWLHSDIFTYIHTPKFHLLRRLLRQGTDLQLLPFQNDLWQPNHKSGFDSGDAGSTLDSQATEELQKARFESR